MRYMQRSAATRQVSFTPEGGHRCLTCRTAELVSHQYQGGASAPRTVAARPTALMPPAEALGVRDGRSPITIDPGEANPEPAGRARAKVAHDRQADPCPASRIRVHGVWVDGDGTAEGVTCENTRGAWTL